MSRDSDRAASVALRGGVKVHVFEPSNRKIWTVVGKRERWLNPEAGYCSCPGFYFANTHGRPGCYHLDAARIAVEDGAVERIVFSDDEFYNFVLGLVSDMQEQV